MPHSPLIQSGLLLSCLCLAFVSEQASGGPASARPGVGLSREQTEDVCTTEARSNWLPEEEMRLLAEHRGYRIKTFKVANNSCYEIYGFDSNGRIVEAYFNPVNARLMRQNIAN